ncbi:MAG TPA: radical SAM protein [Sandaracinaceae bacterium LLY-WYZ-13_1]|nr:radical SAM protein [Sandaracinaceae bacterium LLY-WYZ-13_1]
MKVLFAFFTDPPRPFSSSVAALAAVVRDAGHAPEALEIDRKSAIDDARDAIEQAAPDVLAVSAMSRDWPGARALVERLDPAPYVVVGGYHASMAPRDVAACAAVDAIGIGEGERPLRALLAALERGERPARSRPGLWVRGPAGFADPVPSGDPEPDIAALPRWDYEVFGDVHTGLARGLNTFGPHVDRFLPTRASRGCPFACAYCSAPRWGKTAGFEAAGTRNTRPVAELCDELADLRDRYAPEGFEFWDEHFPVRLAWLRELAREYPRRVGLPFKVEMHPNAASRERLELLVEAGCVLFHCGVEAGDEALRRDVLNRRTRDTRLQQLFDDARELGLETSASLMTALPGETRAQTVETVELLRKLRPGSFMWSTYQPLPGTPLGDAAVAEWPGPARERFDDYEKIRSRTPARLTEAERNAAFHDLNALQASRVADASARADAPAPPRPVEVPAARPPAPDALARLLGLAPPAAPLSARVRVNTATWEAGALSIELEARGLAPRRVDIGPRDGARCYASTDRLALSYRGGEAPARLLEALDALAERLAPLGVEDLRGALDASRGHAPAEATRVPR